MKDRQTEIMLSGGGLSLNISKCTSVKCLVASECVSDASLIRKNRRN